MEIQFLSMLFGIFEVGTIVTVFVMIIVLLFFGEAWLSEDQNVELMHSKLGKLLKYDVFHEL